MAVTVRGFTMPQLMATVAVIGVLTAVAIPTFSQVRTSSSERALHTSLQAVEQAARAAATSGQTGVSRALVTNLSSAAASVEIPAEEIANGRARPFVVDVSSSGDVRVVGVRDNLCGALTFDRDDSTSIVSCDPDEFLNASEATTPSAPAAVEAASSGGDIEVTWEPSGAVLYEVRYAEIDDDGVTGEWVEHGALSHTAASAARTEGSPATVLSGLRSNREYDVQVTAVNFGVDGKRLIAATRSLHQHTSGVTSGTIAANIDESSPAGIVLSWPAAATNDDVLHYQVDRDGQPVAQNLEATTWTDQDAEPGVPYTYEVLAFRRDGTSFGSGPLTGTWDPPATLAGAGAAAVPAPGELTVDGEAPTYTIGWAYDGPEPVQFEVQRRTLDGTIDGTFGPFSDLSWTDSDAATGRAYRYRIRALHAGETSVWSGDVNAFTPLRFDLSSGEPGTAAVTIGNFGSDGGGFTGPFTRLGPNPAEDGPSERNGSPVNNDVEVTADLSGIDPRPQRIRVFLSGQAVIYDGPGAINGDWPVPATGPFTFRLVDIPDGSHTVDIHAVDPDGSGSNSIATTPTFVVRVTPPAFPSPMTVNYDPDGDADTATITWTANDTAHNAQYSIRFRVDGGTWETLQTNIDPSATPLTHDVSAVGNGNVCWQIRTQNDSAVPGETNMSGWQTIRCHDIASLDPPGSTDVNINLTDVD